MCTCVCIHALDFQGSHRGFRFAGKHLFSSDDDDIVRVHTHTYGCVSVYVCVCVHVYVFMPWVSRDHIEASGLQANTFSHLMMMIVCVHTHVCGHVSVYVCICVCVSAFMVSRDHTEASGLQANTFPYLSWDSIFWCSLGWAWNLKLQSSCLSLLSECTCHSACVIRGHHCSVGSLLPARGAWGLNSGRQASWASSLHTEPSCWPYNLSVNYEENSTIFLLMFQMRKLPSLSLVLGPYLLFPGYFYRFSFLPLVLS